MGMCKECKEVFSPLDMIDGYCQECAKEHSITKDNQETDSQKEIENMEIKTEKEKTKSQTFDLVKNIKLVLWLILLVLVGIGVIINSFISKLDNTDTSTVTSTNHYLTKESDTEVFTLAVATVGDDNIIEKICIDGYVYINIYQKKPVMSINKWGTQTALTRFAVLQSTTQSFITNELSISEPEKCKKYGI
jgi:hypothetical protein